MSTTLTPPDGVSQDAWATLAVPDVNGWAIKERDQTGSVIGTAYRRRDGRKDFESGGHRGLILPWPLHNEAGTSPRSPIYVTEGASDTAALLTIGLDAVGVPMAGACADMLSELLFGRHVVVMADADNAGRIGADRIARTLVRRCASVRVIEPPRGAPDARQAIIDGAGAGDFQTLAEEATRIARPPRDGDPILLDMASVTPERVRGLWPGPIPLGRITLLSGRPGDGKSFATYDWAARVSTGQSWPDGAPCEAGAVLLASAEDDPADTVRPRLDAHGADVSRIRMIRGVHRLGRNGDATAGVFTLADVEALEAALKAKPDIRLIVIDPVGSFIGCEIDTHRDNGVRAVLGPLAELAQRYDVAIVLVAHQRKAAATHADDSVMGSRGFTELARSVLHLMPDPDNPDRRLLLPGKCNLGSRAPGLAFTIAGDPARLQWDTTPVAETADSVMARMASRSGGKTSATTEAEEWLSEMLSNGPQPVKDIREAAKRDGIANRTLDRAKANLGVTRTREGFGPAGRSLWLLPLTAPGKHIQRQT